MHKTDSNCVRVSVSNFPGTGNALNVCLDRNSCFRSAKKGSMGAKRQNDLYGRCQYASKMPSPADLTFLRLCVIYIE